MNQRLIFALDGHDAAGKTTLASAVADRIGGHYGRPFHGVLGSALLRAGESGDVNELIAIGSRAINALVEEDSQAEPLVLDRGWMTVASLVKPQDLPKFFETWKRWIPTALCWADLGTTLERLKGRTEPEESESIHRHYLATYWALAEHSKCPVVRTDLYSEEECIEYLVRWIREVERHQVCF